MQHETAKNEEGLAVLLDEVIYRTQPGSDTAPVVVATTAALWEFSPLHDLQIAAVIDRIADTAIRVAAAIIDGDNTQQPPGLIFADRRYMLWRRDEIWDIDTRQVVDTMQTPVCTWQLNICEAYRRPSQLAKTVLAAYERSLSADDPAYPADPGNDSAALFAASEDRRDSQFG